MSIFINNYKNEFLGESIKYNIRAYEQPVFLVQ